MKMSFTNKVVLVTGGSSGIGAAIALKFVEEGAKVAIVGRNEKKLTAVSEKCEKAGSKPLVINADISNDDDAKRIIENTVNKFGTINILINNAGIGSRSDITADDTMKVYDKVMATNVRACVHLTHLASKYLIETKGNIINISSVAALSTAPRGSVAYCTSKAALDHFTRAVASELASEGVRANTINPGPVKTDIIENMGIGPEGQARIFDLMTKTTALKRISESEEIADLALFLASDKAVAITGASFVTDNGYLIKSAV